MGFLFNKRPSNLPDFTGLQIQTSVNTMPIPIIYGSPRVTVQIIYYNDFMAKQVRSSTSGKGGGKGLLSGGKGGGQVTYNYYATLILAIGEGPDPAAFAPLVFNQYSSPGLGFIWVVFEDQGIYNVGTLAGGINPLYVPGDPRAVPWSFLVENHPSDVRTYPNTAYLASALWPLDSSATVPQFNLLINGIFQGTCPLYRDTDTIANRNAPASPEEQAVALNMDPSADPALVIYDFLTNLQYGVPGFATQVGVGPIGPGGQVLIDPGIFSTANATNLSVGDSAFQTYCQAVGFGYDVVLDTTEQASSILDRWCKLLGTAIVWTGATLKFIPYWDTPTQTNPQYDSGNERGIQKKYFVPNTTPLFSLTDDDYLRNQDQDPLTYERTDTADVKNTVRLDFKDRSNLWNDNVAESKDENDAEINGIRVDSLGSAQEFSTMGMAKTATQVIVQRNTSIRLRYSFKLGMEFCVLDPMDVVTLTSAKLGISSLAVRLTSIEEDDHGELSCVAEEFPIGSQSPVQYPFQAHGAGVFNTNFPAHNVAQPFVFEPTTAQLQAQGRPTTPIICIGLTGSVPNISGNPATYPLDTNYGGADIYGSTDNVTYALLGHFEGHSTMGYIVGPLESYSSSSNPDNVIFAQTNSKTISGMTLHFAAVPGGVTNGMIVTCVSQGYANIPPGTTVTGTTGTTVTISNAVTGSGIAKNETIAFGGTIVVNLLESGGELLTVTSAQAAGALSACALYNNAGQFEIFSYTEAILVAPNTYALTGGLYRGLYSTSGYAMTSADANGNYGQFCFIADGNFFQTALPPQFVGVQIYLKFTSFNTFNQAEQPISIAAPVPVVPVGNNTPPPTSTNCFITQFASSPVNLGDPSAAVTCAFDCGVTTAVPTLNPSPPPANLSFDFGVA